jgi:parallel beta-helix repeat protein
MKTDNRIPNHSIIHPFIHSAKLVTIFLFFVQAIIAAEIRYVSKTGSSTPPYTSWETASDSIQKAINISSFGDTIYVANGVYKEQVVMIPGLSLIGSGMDSCIIDTRALVNNVNFASVELKDSCLITGFNILVYNNTAWGWGIKAVDGLGNNKILANKIITGGGGIDAGFNSLIENNICSNVTMGVWLFSSNAVVRKNIIHTDWSNNPQAVIIAGVYIQATSMNTHSPLIDSNYIVCNIGAQGIRKSFGAKPVISNNIIILTNSSRGIELSLSDSTFVYNNLIIAESGYQGIYNYATQYLRLKNNYVFGNFFADAISIGPYNTIINNIATKGKIGISTWSTDSLVLKYNNSWNNEINYSGFSPDSTNLSIDPMVVKDYGTSDSLDFHLQMFSPLIDAGDPNILDKDGSRSDIGLYGGPYGESYKYLDYPPRPPKGLTVLFDSSQSNISIKWKKNTESDFNHYKLFRDTVFNFTADSSNLIGSFTDTFYTHIIPIGTEKFYYKLTAVDNQGNESGLSEEVGIIIVSVNDEWQMTSSYQLFQNYPNPFNPSTTISYRLKERGYVKLYIYDTKGELIDVLVNQFQEGGYYEVEFSANKKTLASGVYIYQIMVSSENNIPSFSNMKKMLLIK